MMTQSIVQKLNQLLADHQVYYQKLRKFHWYVTGHEFFTLHEKFEEWYTQTAKRIDELAERILSIGERPVATYKEYLALATIEEETNASRSKEMMRCVLADLQTINQSLRDIAAEAGDAGDTATANLVEEFADDNEKTIWFIRAYLSE